MPAKKTWTEAEILPALQAVLVDVLGVDEENCEPEATLVDGLGLGVHEEDLPQLLDQLKRTFGKSFARGSSAFLTEDKTVGWLCEHIKEKLGIAVGSPSS